MTNGPALSECEYLTLAFSPINAPLRMQWRNNGLSADFLGDYVTTFLPGPGSATAIEKGKNDLKYAVTYIANELLENAMKYHQRDVDIPIKIHLELAADHVTVRVSNGVGTEQAMRYKTFVEQLQQEDAADQILRQQEESAANKESSVSCLGLLTMISDYDARLDWSFEDHPSQAGVMTVTTSAILPLRPASGEPA